MIARLLADDVGGGDSSTTKGLLGPTKVIEFVIFRIVFSVLNVGILAKSTAKADALLCAGSRGLGGATDIANSTTCIIDIATSRTDPIIGSKVWILEMLLRTVCRAMAVFATSETSVTHRKIWTL